MVFGHVARVSLLSAALPQSCIETDTNLVVSQTATPRIEWSIADAIEPGGGLSKPWCDSKTFRRQLDFANVSPLSSCSSTLLPISTAALELSTTGTRLTRHKRFSRSHGYVELRPSFSGIGSSISVPVLVADSMLVHYRPLPRLSCD